MVQFCGDVMKELDSSCVTDAFIFCDLNITQSDKDLLDEVKVMFTDEPISCYEVGGCNKFWLIKTLQEHGNNQTFSEDVALLITNIIKDFKSNPARTIALASISFSLGSNNTIPYWHQDNRGFTEKDYFTISVCLKGPHTLFVKPSEEQESYFNMLYKHQHCGNGCLKNRYEELDYFFSDNERYQASNYQAAIFKTLSRRDPVTQSDKSAWHSFPYDFNEQRMCLFIVAYVPDPLILV